jgi:hypothetical protein
MTPWCPMRKVTLGLVLLGLMFGTNPAESGTVPDHGSVHTVNWWLATGLGAGALSPDQSLADYRWETSPTALYALQAIAGRGRFATGLRLSRWATTQGTGLDSPESDPQVGLTQLDLIGQLRLVEFAGFQFWGSALVGRVNVSYTPDQLVIEAGVPGQDIVVDYKPITETSLGLGLEIKRDFGRRLTAAVVAERATFSLDTSHRRGSEIVSQRQQFVNWSLRLQVSWVLDLG